MNGNWHVPFYVIVKGNIYDGKQAFFGTDETLTLWRVYINRTSYFKYNEYRQETSEPVKEISVEEANRLVEKGYRGKPVLISSNCTELDEKYYELEKYLNDNLEWENFKVNVKKEYNDVGKIELFKQNGIIF